MKKQIIILFIALISATTSFGQTAAKRKVQYNLENGLAIQGFDPVAYFTQSKAVKGKSSISSNVEGVIYNFSSPANKALFDKNPANYEPQYGGWCSYAMGAKGEKVEIDPEHFKIVDGKLNLFFYAFYNNTLKSWNQDEVNLKKKADANWKKYIN